MAILDLQGLEAEAPSSKARRSGASKGCGNVSTLSLLLC